MIWAALLEWCDCLVFAFCSPGRFLSASRSPVVSHCGNLKLNLLNQIEFSFGKVKNIWFFWSNYAPEDKCHKEPGSRRRKCELFLVWKMFLVRQGRGYELWTGGDCSKSDILRAISWDKNIWKPPFKLHKVLRKITRAKQMLLYIKSLLKLLLSKNLPAFVCEALKVFPYCGKCLKCLRLQPW